MKIKNKLIKARKFIGYIIMSIAIIIAWFVLSGLIYYVSDNTLIGLLTSTMLFIVYFGIRRVNKK